MIVIQGEIHSSKNSRRILPTKSKARPFILAKSKNSKADESSFALQFNTQREEWERMIAGKKYPLSVCFRFRRATRRRFDYCNMAQGLLDAMVKATYIPDDDADHVIPVFVPYQLDKENPGCDILI
jgi:hypothetical protein